MLPRVPNTSYAVYPRLPPQQPLAFLVLQQRCPHSLPFFLPDLVPEPRSRRCFSLGSVQPGVPFRFQLHFSLPLILKVTRVSVKVSWARHFPRKCCPKLTGFFIPLAIQGWISNGVSIPAIRSWTGWHSPTIRILLAGAAVSISQQQGAPRGWLDV